MNFQTRNFNSNSLPIIRLDETVIQDVNYCKFLGIYIDNHLSWTKQILTLVNKLNSGIYVLRRILQTCGFESALQVYHSLFMSHISYGIILWGNSSHQNIDLIFKTQKRALRFLLEVNQRESCKAHFIAQNLLTVPSLYIFQTLVYIKRRSQNLTHLENIHNYHTRNKINLLLSQHRLKTTEQHPVYIGSKLFNHLPPHIRTQPLKIFTSILKKYLIKKAFYSVEEFWEQKCDLSL